MRDLYEVLGVRRDASQTDIRGAYRRAAKKLHPDVGGEPEAFRELQFAYDVLSDVDYRAKYDRDGTLPDLKPVEDPTYMLVSTALEAVLHQHSGIVAEIDLVGEVRDYLATKVREYREQIGNLGRMAEGLLAADKKIRKRPTQDVFGEVVRARAVAANNDVNKMNMELTAAERAVAVLFDYVGPDMEKKPQPTGNPYDAMIQIMLRSSTRGGFKL